MIDAVIAILLALCVVWLVTGLLRAILRNIRNAEETGRDRFRQRLQGTRLQSQLRLLGIDPERYLRLLAAADIERQLYNCTHCVHTERCDECLTGGCADLTFCPNHGELRALAAG